MTNEKYPEALIRQIEAAFADSLYPGDEQLVKKPEHWESWKIPHILKGKHWKDVSPEEIFELRFNLSHFTPEAFCFYIPAYLITSLNGTYYAGEIIETVYYGLDPHENQSPKFQDFLDKIKLFSQPQIVVIKSFVKWFMENESHKSLQDERTEAFWNDYDA